MYRVASLCLAILVIILFASSCSFAAGKILCSTAWDDQFLYFGFVVDDQNIVGSNKMPNSKPWDDDDIELHIDMKHDGSTTLSPSVIRMAVSPAGGSSFAVGKDGQWEPKNIFTYKYGATVQGTLNNSEDIDRTFSVEVALPWSELGGKPTVGQIVGVDVFRTMHGDVTGFVALAPEVKTPADVTNPSKWVNMQFVAAGATADQMTSEKLLCPQLAGSPPLIDGLLKAKEWSSAAIFQMNQPQAEEPEQDNTPTAKVESKQQKYPNGSLVISPFYYWFQGDSRKPNANDHVRKSDGSLMMTDEPIGGAGPWMSYDRVQWYKDELQDARKAGIDALLPVYRGDAASRKGYADQGLDCMAQALKELRAEGKEYPLIGMMLDTTSMQTAYGAKPSLLDEEVQRTLYGMINDFFSHVPEEFLLVSQLDPSRQKLGAYTVFLSASDSFSDMDPGFVKYCNAAFARDFRDARLLWIGDSGFKQKVPDLDGYITLQAGLGAKFDDSGWLDIAAVGPGFDDSKINPQSAKTRDRQNGKTYQNDWTELIAKKPDIIVVDSWNGFQDGSEVCPSKQYGFNYAEMTAVEAMRYRGMRELDAAFLRHNIPDVVSPQSIQQVDLVVKNVGTRVWRAGEGFGLSYRWFKNDKFVEDGVVKVPLIRDIQPGHMLSISTGILAQDKNGQSIPPGQYELHFEMLQSTDKWFSDTGSVPLVVAVRVGLPTDARARFISSNLPTFLKSGASYPYKVILRNDGANPWKRGTSVEAICRLYRANVYTHDSPKDQADIIDLKTARMMLPADVEPGRTLELNGTLDIVDSAGKPIVADAGDDLASYRLRWAIWSDKKWLGESDGSPYCQNIRIVPADSGAQFLGCIAPKEMEAGKTTECAVTIRNSGLAQWKGGAQQLGYHWYRQDGSEVTWDGPKQSVRGVAPGEMAAMQMKVTAPTADGQYYLVWDIARGGTWASTTPSTRGGETLSTAVTVKKGKSK
jgi:hypothetical protein